jgi:hypothetical protein
MLVEHDLLVHDMGNQTYITTEKDKRLFETMQQKGRIDINGSLLMFRKQKYVSENMPFKNPVVELKIQLDHLFYNIVIQREV